MLKDLRSVLNFTVLVAGLGYFVDLFDITLFGVLRVASLRDLGVTDPEEILRQGLFIYNAQMAGLMIGGLMWGYLADRRGRISVLFGSILLYSLANIANAFVTDVPQYALCRFLGGLGLAGELGAAVTLVAESLPKEKRGLGTTLVAFMGMMGILAAALVGQSLSWKTCYILGGVMGLALLAMRFRVAESGLFANQRAQRPDWRLFLRQGRLAKYLRCILIGMPIYFTTGVLFIFAPELAAGLDVKGAVSAGDALIFGSIGLTVGDLFAGLLSQKLRSRKKAIFGCLVTGLILTWIYALLPGLTNTLVYGLSFFIGCCVGYWAVLVTVAAEQFGTNLRGTVATTVPNFVRGTGMIAASLFAYLKGPLTASTAAIVVATLCFGGALWALSRMEETFHRDLDFEEG